jgi:hypothetical protein
MSRGILALLLLATALPLAACSENVTRGAAIGAAGGATVGLIRGDNVLGNAATGAAAGAAGGFIYDRLFD